MRRLNIRVLVVDDSALIRQMLVRALSLDPRIEIVGTARNGVEAIEQARALNPDVITLDVDMPELTGLEALVHIRKNSTARVVMLTSDSDSDTMFKALALGAVDFMAKPTAGMANSLTELTETLLKKIRSAHRMPITQGSDAESVQDERSAVVGVQSTERPFTGNRRPQVFVGIAASTGGPPALERVFSGLTPELPATYLIVQHLPSGFSASLARRLSGVGVIPISEAIEGQTLECGHAYIIPYGVHATVVEIEGLVHIHFVDTPPRHGVRPSADTLFESLAEQLSDRAVGVVLTGMGADGAMGAVALRSTGATVVVQDEETSAIWGMPGSVVRSGAASRVVPLPQIAAEIRRAVRSRSRESNYG